jgi:hypothetical protein
MAWPFGSKAATSGMWNPKVWKSQVPPQFERNCSEHAFLEDEKAIFPVFYSKSFDFQKYAF